jgi:16S rRNA (uracil1498-N3)-methyltransferase
MMRESADDFLRKKSDATHHFFLDSVVRKIYTFVSRIMYVIAALDEVQSSGSAGKRNQAKQHIRQHTRATRYSSVARGVFAPLFKRVSRMPVIACARRDDACKSILIGMTRRRFIADTFNADTATLTGDQAAHLARVLRAQPGQVFDVVANGFLHRAEILSVNDGEVVFALHEELEADAALPVHMLLAVFKFDHFEWGVEKLTELGVRRVTPVLARRTEKHLAQAAAKRVERWRRIALESAKQSRRTDVPIVDDPALLAAALKTVEAQTKLLLAETEAENSLAASLQNAGALVALAVGPEGGWTTEEMFTFTAAGWKHVTLGARILRAETAAIAALSICSALL